MTFSFTDQEMEDNDTLRASLRMFKDLGLVRSQGAYGCASDEEKKLSMALFSSIFDSLSKMEYDADLFGKALPCLTAIGSALPPDYAMMDQGEDDMFAKP